MDHGRLPDGLVRRRTTDTFTAATTPAGLRRAHRVAAGVWGVLAVEDGRLTFVWEDRPDEPVVLGPGDTLVIPPEVLHHVEPAADARFAVSFFSSSA